MSNSINMIMEIDFKIGDIVTPFKTISYNDELLLEPGMEMEIIYITESMKFVNVECEGMIFINLRTKDLLSEKEFENILEELEQERLEKLEEEKKHAEEQNKKLV